MIHTIRSHPQLLWMVGLQISTIYVYFFLSIFISQVFTITTNATIMSMRNLSNVPCKHGHNGAPPPPVWNHAKTRWVLGVHLQEKYRQIAVVVSARYFDAMAIKKIEYSLNKLSLSPRAGWSVSCRIIVNKIKEQLVSHTKMHHLVVEIEIDCATYSNCAHL